MIYAWRKGRFFAYGKQRHEIGPWGGYLYYYNLNFKPLKFLKFLQVMKFLHVSAFFYLGKNTSSDIQK